jgi:hypothetical protein
MAEAKIAPNLPDWMVKHANRYLASGGTEGHMHTVDVPGRGEITAPALLLTTTGRWREVHLSAVLRNRQRPLLRDRLEGRRAPTPWVVPQYPRQPGCRGASRDQEAEGAGQDGVGRRTYSTLEQGARALAALRRLSAQHRTRDTGGRPGPRPLSLPTELLAIG